MTKTQHKARLDNGLGSGCSLVSRVSQVVSRFRDSRNQPCIFKKHAARELWKQTESATETHYPEPPHGIIAKWLNAPISGYGAYPQNNSTACAMQQVADHKALQLLVAETWAIPWLSCLKGKARHQPAGTVDL